ncbi:MAG: M14 family zinc carboxypeptidase [Myxococcota bacterium]
MRGYIKPIEKIPGKWWKQGKYKNKLRVFNSKYSAVIRPENGYLLVSLPLERLDEIKALGFDFYPDSEWMFKSDFESYPDWPVMKQEIAQLYHQNQNSDLQLYQLGFTYENYPVYLFVLGDLFSNKPVVRITGAHHGDEIISSQVVLGQIKALLQPEYADYLNKFVFLFVPVVNPEGYDNDTRYNSSGIDLNRQYGADFSSGQSNYPYTSREVQFLWKLANKYPAVLSLDYHSVAEYVNCVYDYAPFPSADEDLILDLGSLYAQAADLDLIVGFDWYQARGTAQDAFYAFLGTFAYTVENLQPQPYEDLVQENIAGLFRLLDGVAPLIKCGQVVDQDQTPLVARLQLTNYPRSFYTNDSGWFCRIFPEGELELQIYSPGYQLEVVDNFFPLESEDIVFALTPQVPAADGSFEFTPLKLVAFGDNTSYDVSDEENWAADGLGQPDEIYFNLLPGGFVEYDFGFPLQVGENSHIEIVNFSSESHYQVFVRQSREEQWHDLGVYQGNEIVQLHELPFENFRFIKIMNSVLPGEIGSFFALDAIIYQGNIDTTTDNDGDGFELAVDCDDNNDQVYPGAEEQCNGVDNNCNLFLDDGFYFDSQGERICEEDDASVPDIEDIDSGDGKEDINSGCSCKFGSAANSFFSPLFFLFILLLFPIRKICK